MTAQILAYLGMACVAMTFFARWRLGKATHGTTRMAIWMSMLGFGALSIVLGGISILITQHGGGW